MFTSSHKTWNGVDTNGYQDQTGGDALSKYLLYIYIYICIPGTGNLRVGILEVLKCTAFSRPIDLLSTIRADKLQTKSDSAG